LLRPSGTVPPSCLKRLRARSSSAWVASAVNGVFSDGFTRGKIYFPIRNEDGSISGFIGYADGQLKVPPQWIGTNAVTFPKKSA
jgi:hypothetical protein